MKNVKLKLEDLQVETFETTGSTPGRGTVRGNAVALSFYPCGSVDYTACDAQCPRDTDYTECDCGPTGNDNSCQGLSCDVVGDTCYDPCGFSDATNCHRCR